MKQLSEKDKATRDKKEKSKRKWGSSIKDEPGLHIGEEAYFINNKGKKITLWSKND